MVILARQLRALVQACRMLGCSITWPCSVRTPAAAAAMTPSHLLMVRLSLARRDFSSPRPRWQRQIDVESVDEPHVTILRVRTVSAAVACCHQHCLRDVLLCSISRDGELASCLSDSDISLSLSVCTCVQYTKCNTSDAFYMSIEREKSVDGVEKDARIEHKIVHAFERRCDDS